MKDIVNKVVTNPAFIGSVYGAIAGTFSGLIIANADDKPKGPTIKKYLSIGMVTGSSIAAIVDSCNNIPSVPVLDNRNI